MVIDFWFYLTAIPAVLIYGISKGGFGGALGVVAVPLMALTTPAIQAASILLPVLCIMDIFAIRYHYKHCDYSEIKSMLPSAIIGIIIASLIMGIIANELIEIFIGSISLVFCIQYYAKRSSAFSSKFAVYFWSFLSGFSSTMIHAGGGPISIYLLPKKLNKLALVGTMAVFFGALNYIKLIPYTLLGQFDIQNLMTSLVLMPFAPLGVKIGTYLLQRIEQEHIYRACYFLLLVSSLKLLYSGVVAI